MAGLLEAYTNAVGRQFERLAGVPTTRLTRSLNRLSPEAETETTLAFPYAGAFFADGVRFAYTSKSGDTFIGLTPDRQFLLTLPAGTLVSLDITTAPPE